jgi:hypothetical protein
MEFATIKSLLDTLVTEGADINSDYGLGTREHPSLSRAEIVRMNDKFTQAQAKLEEIENIFKSAAGVSGPAHKLHHIGVKGGLDISAISGVQQKIRELGDAIDDCHQMWGTSVQGDTGAFDDDTTSAPNPEEVDADMDISDEGDAAPADTDVDADMDPEADPEADIDPDADPDADMPAPTKPTK